MPGRLPSLGAQELALMKVVWRLGEVSVRDVYETLRRRRQLAYTTVMTMMNTLEAKGCLKRALHGRAYRYRPAVCERRVVKTIVKSLWREYSMARPGRCSHISSLRASCQKTNARNCGV